MNPRVRDLIIVAVMIIGGVWIMFFPPKKPDPNLKIDLSALVPQSFLDWKSMTYKTADYKDQWQSINELLVRTYSKGEGKQNIDFVLEYSSDVRRAFSFHFPENCYRAGGNPVTFLQILNVPLPDGKMLKAKCLFIKGMPGQREKIDKIIVYWLVLEGKQIYDTLGVKIDQMLAGLTSKARQGFLVRIDVREEVKLNEDRLRNAQDLVRRYISDLYTQLSDDQRRLIFGKF